MRIFTGLAALVLGFMATTALAGNVLLPSQGSTTPNYGLVPQTATQEAPAAVPVMPTPSAPATQPQATTAQKAVPTAQPPVAQDLPDGMSSMDDTAIRIERLRQMGIDVKPATISPEIQKIKDEIDRKYKAMIPPSPPIIATDVGDQIHGVNDAKIPGTTETAYKPTGSVTVSFVNAVFDSRDFSVIEDSLGYNSKQARSACVPRLSISLMSAANDNSTFSVPVGQSKTAPFTAPADRMMVSVQAVCETPRTPLPQRGAFLWRSNGKLIVDLATSDCQMPARATSTMKAQYSGNGALACVYTN